MKRILLFAIAVMSVIASISANDTTGLALKVDRIHRKILSVDSHTDTPLALLDSNFNIAERHDPSQDNRKIDFPRMKEGRLDAAFLAVFVSQGKRTPEGNQKAMKQAQLLFDSIHAMLGRNKKGAGLALCPADAYKLKKEGRLAFFIGVENGYVIGNDLNMIKVYYNLGARYITLCHTRNNDICDSSTDSTEWNGLSPFGKNVVLYMNKVGMMVDVSHASDKSFYDILATSKVPVIASHSCARAICDNKRNLDDNMLRALAKNGGVIQVCILSEYVKTPEPYPARDSAFKALRKKYHNFENLTDEQSKQSWKEWDVIDEKYPRKLATVQDVVDHIDHIVKVAGIDHVGIGTDFDGGGGVTGCFDASEMKNITRELILRGYSESDIKKIWGGNLMRVMNKVRAYSIKVNKECNCN